MPVDQPVTDREVEVPAEYPIVSCTDQGGRIGFVNQTFVSVSGFTREAPLRAPHNIVRHPPRPKFAA